MLEYSSIAFGYPVEFTVEPHTLSKLMDRLKLTRLVVGDDKSGFQSFIFDRESETKVLDNGSLRFTGLKDLDDLPAEIPDGALARLINFERETGDQTEKTGLYGWYLIGYRG